MFLNPSLPPDLNYQSQQSFQDLNQQQHPPFDLSQPIKVDQIKQAMDGGFDINQKFANGSTLLMDERKFLHCDRACGWEYTLFISESFAPLLTIRL